MKTLEWVLLGLFAMLMLCVILWPVLPYVLGWLVLFDWWRVTT